MKGVEEKIRELERCTGSYEVAREVYEIFLRWEEEKRAMVRVKQMEGIQRARDNGVALGRPKIEEPDNFSQIVNAWEQRKLNAAEAAKLCGIGMSTFYRRVNDLKGKRQNEEK